MRRSQRNTRTSSVGHKVFNHLLPPPNPKKKKKKKGNLRITAMGLCLYRATTCIIGIIGGPKGRDGSLIQNIFSLSAYHMGWLSENPFSRYLLFVLFTFCSLSRFLSKFPPSGRVPSSILYEAGFPNPLEGVPISTDHPYFLYPHHCLLCDSYPKKLSPVLTASVRYFFFFSFTKQQRARPPQSLLARPRGGVCGGQDTGRRVDV